MVKSMKNLHEKRKEDRGVGEDGVQIIARN